jgi:hypothetical protein
MRMDRWTMSRHSADRQVLSAARGGRCESVARRRDQDQQQAEGGAARLGEQVREARNEVFRAYVRAREQASLLPDDADSDTGRGTATMARPPDPGR